jgi:hypothetical protein
MNMFQLSNNDILYCLELHEAFIENQCSRLKYIEIKHYIICDEVQKGESDSQIHISTDEQISRHFSKAPIQDERVCVLKLELMETTSLLKKEEMTPRLGGSVENIIEDIH